MVIAGAVELVGWVHRIVRRRTLFALAQTRTQALRQRTGQPWPLVVVGSPEQGPTGDGGGAYTCGDVCVDLAGCPRCGAPPRDLTHRGGIPVDDARAVVFVSCVLEYVGDIEAAWAECLRASGGGRNVFVAAVQPWARGTAHFYPGARYVVEAAPPEAPELRYRRARRDPYRPAFARRVGAADRAGMG